MIEDQVKKLIQLRLQQARESLLETDTLYQVDLWRGTINRAYYAMFYAVLALAVYRQEITSKHSGLITFFDREFVKEGVFPKELSKLLHLAFQKRQESDYGDVFEASQEEAQQARENAATFVDAIEWYLRNLIQ